MKKTAKYKTSDGYKFYNEHDAKNHARTLKDRKVTPLDGGLEPIKEETTTAKETVEKAPEKATKEAKEDFRQVLKKVLLAESLEELVEFETDDRKSIKDAVAKRKEELIAEDATDKEGQGTEGSESDTEGNS